MTKGDMPGRAGSRTKAKRFLRAREWWFLAVGTAMTCGLLEVTWAVARTGSRLGSWRFLILPLGATTLVALVAFCVLGAMLRGICSLAGHSKRPTPLMPAFSVVLAVALVNFVLLVDQSPKESLVDLLFLGPICVAALLGARFLATVRLLERAILAAPVALAIVLAYVLLEKHAIGTFGSPSSLAAAAGTLALLMAVAWWASNEESRRLELVPSLLFLLLAAACLSALLLPTAWPGPRREVAESKGQIRHLILITIDTLRADRLGIYGAEGDPTPNLDNLAREGIVFEEAATPAPWTLPLVTSIMTGVSPLVHRTTDSGDVVPRALLTLAEIMQDAGYRTGTPSMKSC